jgi:cell filamentation protein
MDDVYVYPGTNILKNKLGLTDAASLDMAERRLTRIRAVEGLPTGAFDLDHLQAIHRHLFQDLYDWAGEIRKVEIAKGGNQFMFRQFIRTGMADIHRRIIKQHYFRGLARTVFAEKVGPILGDVNYVHPFREGNGRTQLYYLKQLCHRAGHPLDLRCLPAEDWINASRVSHKADYWPMIKTIDDALQNSIALQKAERPTNKPSFHADKKET